LRISKREEGHWKRKYKKTRDIDQKEPDNYHYMEGDSLSKNRGRLWGKGRGREKKIPKGKKPFRKEGGAYG